MCNIKPCPNQNCVDGYETGRPAPAEFPLGRDAYLRTCPRLRACTACGGRGFLADERENRRHYYDMLALEAEVEAGSRFRDGDDDDIYEELIPGSRAIESALSDLLPPRQTEPRPMTGAESSGGRHSIVAPRTVPV